MLHVFLSCYPTYEPECKELPADQDIVYPSIYLFLRTSHDEQLDGCSNLSGGAGGPYITSQQEMTPPRSPPDEREIQVGFIHVIFL